LTDLVANAQPFAAGEKIDFGDVTVDPRPIVVVDDDRLAPRVGETLPAQQPRGEHEGDLAPVDFGVLQRAGMDAKNRRELIGALDHIADDSLIAATEEEHFALPEHAA